MLFGVQLELWLVCLIVVLGRIFDVALASIRTVFIVKSKPVISACIGFVEVFFWFIIVKAALDYIVTSAVDTLLIAFAYATGFALGTYLGCLLSKILVKTKIDVQIVLSSKNEELIEVLQQKGFGQTILNARGSKSGTETYLIQLETDSKSLKELKKIIDQYDPKAFVSVKEVKEVVGGYFGDNK